MSDLIRKPLRVLYFSALGVETYMIMIASLLMVRTVPVRSYGRWLGRLDRNTDPPVAVIKDIRRIVHFLAPLLPARSRCLVCAVTAKALLARRGFHSVISLGLADSASGLKAHAWLSAGSLIVTGQSGIEHYREIANF